jgi:hypothetical protein
MLYTFSLRAIFLNILCNQRIVGIVNETPKDRRICIVSFSRLSATVPACCLRIMGRIFCVCVLVRRSSHISCLISREVVSLLIFSWSLCRDCCAKHPQRLATCSTMQSSSWPSSSILSLPHSLAFYFFFFFLHLLFTPRPQSS